MMNVLHFDSVSSACQWAPQFVLFWKMSENDQFSKSACCDVTWGTVTWRPHWLQWQKNPARCWSRPLRMRCFCHLSTCGRSSNKSGNENWVFDLNQQFGCFCWCCRWLRFFVHCCWSPGWKLLMRYPQCPPFSTSCMRNKLCHPIIN